MIFRTTYRPMVVVMMMLFAVSSYSQNCEPNMFTSPDASSFGVVPKTTGITAERDFTIEMWLQSLAFRSGAGLVERSSAAGDSGDFSIRFGDAPYFIITLKLNNGTVTIPTSSLVNPTQWNHLAITFRSRDSIAVYINGERAAGISTSADFLPPSDDSLYIGHSQITGETLRGNLDELRFWNKARTIAEIRNSMNGTASGKELGLVALYKFDDKTSLKRLHDFTGRGSEGVLLSNAECVTSTSPVSGTTAGYMMAAKETVIDLGTVVCTDRADTTVRLFNRGVDTLYVRDRGFYFSYVFNITDDAGFPLPPDSSKFGLIRVQAIFRAPGTYYDTLFINSSNECGGSVRVLFKIHFDSVGIGFDPPQLAITKPQVECDTLEPIHTVTLANTGTRKVTIVSANFLQDIGFEVLSPRPPFVIPVDSSVQMRLRQHHRAEGPYSTSLRVVTAECNRFTDLPVSGMRTVLRYEMPARIEMPSQDLRTGGVQFDTVIVIRNVGSSDFSVLPPSITGAGFKFPVATNGGYLYTGDSLVFRVRFESNGCGVFTGALHVTGKPCGVDTTIVLQIIVNGPKVVLFPQSDEINIGVSCSPKDTVITFVNRSDLNVTLSRPVFSKQNIFSLINANDLPKLLKPGDTIRIPIRFAPSVPGEHFVRARFPLSPCGEVAVNLRGLLGVGRFILSDSSAEFGQGCDLSPQKVLLTVINDAEKSVTINDSRRIGSPSFTITSPQLPVSLEHGDAVTFTIEYSPLAEISEEAFFVLESGGCYVTSFSARGTRERADVSWLSPTVEFDTICPTHSTIVSAQLMNGGAAQLSIADARIIGTANTFTLSNVIGMVLPANGQAEIVTSFHPASVGEFDAILEVILSPCNDTARIGLHGVGGPKPTLLAMPRTVDFGKLRVGQEDTICVDVVNPSCLPVVITPNDILISIQNAFSLSTATLSSLPAVVTDSTPFTVCVIFHPEDTGVFRAVIPITVGSISDTIVVTGEGGVPSLKYSQTIIEFGDVTRDSVKVDSVIITNIGSMAASLAFTKPMNTDFSVLPVILPDRLGVGNDTVFRVEFKPSVYGLATDRILVRWEEGVDTILLRGRGTPPGVQLSKTQIDFGDVRLKAEKTDIVSVSATEGFPVTLSSVTVTGIDKDSFEVVALDASNVLESTADTLHYQIHFRPEAEQIYRADIIFGDGITERGSVPLLGRGVEAHLVILDTPLVDFGDVPIGTPITKSVSIKNTGQYPLEILSAQTNNDAIYSTDGWISNTPVAPGEVSSIPVVFTPQKGINYPAVLVISADAPEGLRRTNLVGKGVFAPQTYPMVTYNVGDMSVQVGDIVDVPITIGGSDLPRMELDSFVVTIHYDPSIAAIHDVITMNTLSQNMLIASEHRIKDSTVTIAGYGKLTDVHNGVLFYLRTEALLGPVDSTRFYIGPASPLNTAPQFLSSGLFFVTDCGNYRTNVIFKGAYSINAAKPNPATTSVVIDYELGLDAPVRIELYDAMGKYVRTVLNTYQRAGNHNVQVRVDDLPSGEYHYRLRSLEYQGTERFIIMK